MKLTLNTINTILPILTALLLAPLAGPAHAVEIEWVTVGDPGNNPDKTGHGAVA